MIIAGHQKRQEFGKLTPSITSQICNALRHPDPGERSFSSIIHSLSDASVGTSVGYNIYKNIIPLVDHLRHLMPLQLSTMFAPSLLQSYKLKSTIRCHDLEESDSFFNAIGNK